MGTRTLGRAGRLLALMTATASALVLGALPASAAPPSNDTSATATPITAVPFNDSLDTTEATTDAEDAAVNAECGAPATNGSVWYQLEAGDVAGYLVDVSQSSFLAGVIVATGSPGNLTLYWCGPDAVAFETTPGETYYVMAFSDNPDVVGGQLNIEVSEAHPAPKIDMEVNEVGRVNKKTGTATISGTYTCDGNPEIVEMFGWLQQEQGQATVNGTFEKLDLECGGVFDWSAEITPEEGKFKPGLAATLATTVGCSALGCNFYDALEVVRLRAGGRD
jgi:hypothetical protein